MCSKVSRFSLIPLVIFTLIFGFSCRKKDKADSNPAFKLTFSTDTVFFDTVFTTVGSVTQRLMVHNYNANKVLVSSIRLAGGSSSVFSLNIDGTPASSVSDVEIPAHDSIFIFVKVTVNPNSQNLPLIVTDSILFSTNGNLQQVELVAWGQDAYFYKNKNLTGNETWDSIKPHVIYGYLRIDTGSSLTISAGTKLYFHKSAYLEVSDLSSLTVNGVLGHPVWFLGDRLDEFYRDLPGQWDGIYLRKGSKNNDFNYAIIKNGNFGIYVDTAINPDEHMLNINNSIIQNMVAYDIYAYSTNIIATNCVLGNCGGSALAINFGGSYDFRQMTIGNYWSGSVRQSAALYLNNYYYDTTGVKHYNPLTNAYFGNVIIYGDQDEELNLDGDAASQFSYYFDYCLLKTHKNANDASHYNTCIVNKDPGFVDVQKYDYEIDSISPARQKGKFFNDIPMDINGTFWDNPRAIGAYEYVPQ
jgi:hypothetical protein